MTKTKYLVAEAKAPELERFLTENLGIQVKPNTPVPTLRSMVKSAYNAPEFTLSASASPEQVPAPAGADEALAKAIAPENPDTVKVIISATDDDDGNEPVFLACNGVGMYVPRGEEAEIPYRYFEVLKNAVQFKYDPIEGGGLSPPRRVQLYPYSRVA